ncbi:MAG: AAA family ATPase [Candidatus Omnitrophica bacterium]|nr:AAA family ATPase [Candidatus Omnitrophota bacterium]
MLIHKRIKIFFIEHWVKFLVIFATIILIALAIWGLSTLESFYLHMTLATLPLQFLMVAINALIFVYMYMTVFRGGFAKLEKGLVRGDEVHVMFKDVIGIDEAKQEAWEVVQLIKDRRRLQQIGGKVIRGILMLGPPGCGKTYLAKAVAAEAGIPFISMSASEFTEIFVGVGASRMRKLFKKARRLAEAHGGCIVFIDELDAVGRKRSFSYLGGGMETNTTQNQLLVEMDGLKENEQNVIVIGATNAPEYELDEALKRPGRFDRKVYIDKPNLEGRQRLFEYYLSKVKFDKSIDVGKLAKQAVYKSPADIMNIVKESALIATRNKRDMVTHKDISEAIDRIDLGIKHRKFMTPGEKEMTAYHESGHLVVLYLRHPTKDVFKASIISHKGSLGMVQPQQREELHTQSKESLMTDIEVSLAGYVAEKIKYGTTSSGVIDDFKKAMAISHTMVWSLGMGTSDLVGDYTIYGETRYADANVFYLAESTKEKLNKETQEIIHVCLKEDEELLKKEWYLVERFVKELLEKEELEYDEIDAIFKEYGKKQLESAK